MIFEINRKEATWAQLVADGRPRESKFYVDPNVFVEWLPVVQKSVRVLTHILFPFLRSYISQLCTVW